MNYSDPTGHYCYTEGPLAGECFDGGDRPPPSEEDYGQDLDGDGLRGGRPGMEFRVPDIENEPDWEYGHEYDIFVTDPDDFPGSDAAFVASLFAELRKDPNSFFPFSVEGGSIRRGRRLCVKPVGLCDYVGVLYTNEYSFGFVALADHIEGEGGEIHFGLNPSAGSGGRTQWSLTVAAHGYGSGGSIRSRAAESILWDEMARKITAASVAYYNKWYASS